MRLKNTIAVCFIVYVFALIFDLSTANAQVTKPEIKTRAEWGADERLVTEAPEYKDVTHLVVHHTADLPDGIEQGRTDEERVKSIYRYHAGKFGDVGYNAIIGSDGTIYEGKRGQGGAQLLEDGVVGAHAFGFNRHTFSVSLLGNFNNGPVPKAMRDSLIHLLAFEAQKWGIDPESKIDFVRSYHSTLSEADKRRVPERDAEVSAIEGHGKLPRQCTDCPGAYVKADLEQIRKDVADHIRAN